MFAAHPLAPDRSERGLGPSGTVTGRRGTSILFRARGYVAIIFVDAAVILWFNAFRVIIAFVNIFVLRRQQALHQRRVQGAELRWVRWWG